jgi:methyl-accepting chemotaxis protein
VASKKEYPLSIVLRTVDRVTAGLRQISARIDNFWKRVGAGAERAGAPWRRLGSSIKALGDAAGVPKVLSGLTSGLRGVASVGASVVKVLGAVAIGAGLGTAALKGQIDQLDALAKTADRLGLTVDALAELRFAAGQSGAGAADLDGALDGLSKRLGQARAGSGSLASFLEKVSPALLRQLKATKTNEEAFHLLADAMAKLEDPSKRAALAAAAFGGAGGKLDNLLKQGSAGIEALRQEYAELAGSQEQAARASENINDAMARVSAIFDGVRSTIIEALAPAFLDLAERAKLFFQENRAEIAEWIRAFGEELPARIESLMATFNGIIGVIKPVWKAMGGLRGVAIALGVVLGVKLALALKALGVAMLTTPFGLILTGISALVAGGYLLIKHWDTVKAFFVAVWRVVQDAFAAFLGWVKDIFLNFTPLGLVIKHWEPIKEFFGGLWDGVVAIFNRAWEFIRPIVEKVVGAAEKVVAGAKKLRAWVKGEGETTQRMQDALRRGGNVFEAAQLMHEPRTMRPETLLQGQQRAQAAVKVEFAGAPRGTRVSQDPHSTADVDLSVGYQMLLP